jgi:hypothetical protein
LKKKHIKKGDREMKYKTILLSYMMGMLLLSCDDADISADSDDYKTGQYNIIKEKNLEGVVPAEKKEVDIAYTVTAEYRDAPAELQLFGTIRQSLEEISLMATMNSEPIDTVSKTFDFVGVSSKKYQPESGVKTMMLYDDGNRTMEYFENGAVFFQGGELITEKGEDFLKTQGLTNSDAKEVYAELATEFLSENSLLKKGMYRDRVSLATTTIYDVATRKIIEEKVTNLAVHYGYEIDGIKAWGPGAKAIVFYGNKGDIQGFYSAIRDYAPLRSVGVKAPQNAVRNYMAYNEPKTMMRTFIKDVTSIDIKKVELVYYMAAASETQDVIAPKYLLSGTFTGTDESGNQNDVEFNWLEDAVAK